MKKILLLSTIIVAPSVHAQCASYDVDTRLLSIDTVAVGDTSVTDVVMSLNADGVFSLLSYSTGDQTNQPAPVDPANPTDPATNASCVIDHSISQQLKIGMTLEQVTAIVGCEGTKGLTGQLQAGSIEQYEWLKEDVQDLSLTVLFIDGLLTSSTIF